MNEPSQNDLLFAKLRDKIKFCNTKNKITHTDFFTEPELAKVEKYLYTQHMQNYFAFGGYPDSFRKMIFFYPTKLTYEMAFSNINQFMQLIRITLSNYQKESFEYRDYLSAIMKFGITRERIGDIIVYPEGADIIIQKENSEYFKNNLQELIRFKKATIHILDIANLHENKQEIEEISIIINSMRIDNFVSEICHCSRNKAEEVITQERVMINYDLITKNSKSVNIDDIITIRGFGKFIVKEISRKTKSNKNVVILLHNK